MATQKSSIDEFLLDNQTGTKKPSPVPESPPEAFDDFADDTYSDEPEDSPADVVPEPSDDDDSEELPLAAGKDDYGNDTPATRMYTQEEMNEHTNKVDRDRLARMKAQNQEPPNANQVQKAQENFNYNPDADGNWEQQLEAFVEKTFTKINHRQQSQAQEQIEREAHAEFEDKFTQGMGRFNDFRDVVDAQPITDAMTLALRGMKDPAAFVYAASKRQA